MSQNTGKKKAFVTGISGQDGAYLCQLLLEQGYEVYGGVRRSASNEFQRLRRLGIQDRVHIVSIELLEFTNIVKVLEAVQPDEVYNLAAQSFVGVSFEEPIYTGDVDGLGVTRLLEAIRELNPKIRFYQASTSEMFGKVEEIPQKETTPFHPRSPYGVAKLYGHWIVRNYRESYGIFADSGILFNHESPLRGREFVTRKITATLAQIKTGKDMVLELGNLSAKRDWGHAKDYVRGMWLMLQQDEPGDYLLATGETRTVRDFATSAAKHLGFDLEWKGEGVEEYAIDKATGKTLIRVNPEFYRPAEVDLLIGDSSRAQNTLGWKRDYNFDGLVREMVADDLALAQQGLL